jgi:hypothetical protein
MTIFCIVVVVVVVVVVSKFYSNHIISAFIGTVTPLFSF